MDAIAGRMESACRTPCSSGRRWTSFSLAVCLAACTSAPPPRPAVEAQSPPVEAAVASTEPLQLANYPGYRKTTVRGATKYCREEIASGSRLTAQTVCLTEQQLRQQGIDNQRVMENFSRKQLPASDSNGGGTRP